MSGKDAIKELSSFIDEIERKLATKTRFSSAQSTPAVSSVMPSPAMSSPCLSPRSLAGAGVDVHDLERRNAELVAEINMLKRNTGKLVFTKKTLERDCKTLTDIAKNMRATLAHISSVVLNAEAHAGALNDTSPAMNTLIDLLARLKETLALGSSSHGPSPSPSISSLSAWSTGSSRERDLLAGTGVLGAHAQDHPWNGYSGTSTPSISHSQALRRLNELENENKMLQSELGLFRNEKAALQEQVNSLKGSLDDERRRSLYSSHYSSAASSSSYSSAAASGSSRARSEMASVHIKRIQEVVIANKALEKKLASIEETRNEQQRAISNLESAKASLEEQLELQKNMCDSLTLSYEKTSRQLAEVQAELARYTEAQERNSQVLELKLKDGQSAIAALKSERDTLYKRMNEEMERATVAERERSHMLVRNRETDDQLKAAVQQRSLAEGRVEQLLQTVDGLSRREEELGTEIRKLTVRKSELEADLRTQRQQLDVMREYSESERTKWKTETDTLRSEIESITLDRAAASQRNAELNKRLQATTAELDVMHERVRQAELEREAMEREKTQWLDEYMGAIEALSVEKYELEERLGAATAR
ncbi:hypothetical protein FVE85_0374 [Porphyridium purpureum]|uniref:Uncharacterized protein n=1 Tax=Porphyridium purpureum TaxID=35688 RepID=A0A5J4YZR1_PORPP|nr:hypothetical protein FVE85_0374 [Porphyridium purpureum]|eukprot:POR4488..scf208_2